MKVYYHGMKSKTGARELICNECNAQLGITKTDVKMFIKVYGAKTAKEQNGYFVLCPECGHSIEVKNEMENL